MTTSYVANPTNPLSPPINTKHSQFPPSHQNQKQLSQHFPALLPPMAKLPLLFPFLCFLVFSHCCVARHRQNPQQQQQGECQIRSLNAQEPSRRFEAEAGVTEYWNWNDDQFRCAAVSLARHIIQPRGLLLPNYASTPIVAYIVQGRGIQGLMMPGCPETFQSSQQSQEQEHGQRFQDQHQRINTFQEGDFIAIPAGVAHWLYNDGDRDLIAVIMEDSGSYQNQLDNDARRFFLAGNLLGDKKKQQRERWEGEKFHPAGNIMNGFDVELLAGAFGVDRETARKLQAQEDDQRGHIVKVERGLEVVQPPRSLPERDQQESLGNGLEETVCTAKVLLNINEPSRASIYNPRAGRLTTVNGYNLPVLNSLRLSGQRGVLYRNAMMAPHWKTNAHCILYATGGEARIQIVDHRGQAVFDSNVREGQTVVVPQNFAVVKQAGNNGFEWVAFQTHENAMTSTVAGSTSAIRGIPVDILANSYRISRDVARRLKTSRDETLLFEPSSSYKGRAVS